MFLAIMIPRISRAFLSPSLNAHHLIRPISSQISHLKLFATPEDRTKGKDRAQELMTLANNLKLDPSKLKDVLKQKRAQMEGDSEKGKYIDWLLIEEAPTTKKNPLKRKETSTTQQHSPPKKKKSKDQPAFLTSENFADLKDLHPASKRALTEILKVTSMTEIQSKTFAAASSGSDILGRARTGTGKTLAFLLPAIERVLQNPPPKNNNSIGVLVISPTRELASQIGDQAEKLLTFHKDHSVQVVFGGTNIKRDTNAFQRKMPTILVATPGRLLDHLESTTIKGQKFGKDIMCHTPVVVLDETDRLLDMGFRREIKKILSYMPRQDKRQTLLFSATIPKELKSIMAENMKHDFIEVDCINDAEDDSHTSSDIEQSHVIVPTMDRYVSSVVEIVRLAIDQDPDAKIVTFFPTARQVAFFAEFFNEGLKIPVIELHSKKSQSYRNRASEQFRSASSAILFTSDVSARGVDYPGVTQVIQFGMPDTREQYIHRLGRTGRAGTTGKGWLVLGPFESIFLQELKGLPIQRNDELSDLLNDPIEFETEELVSKATGRIRNSKKNQSSAKSAYQAFLGFYLGKMKRIRMRSKDELVHVANEFSAQMGLPEVPTLTKQLIGKMGLKGVSGITVSAASPEDNNRSNSRRPYAGGSSGGRGHNDHSNGRRKPKSNPRSR